MTPSIKEALEYIANARWNENADLDDICTRADRALATLQPDGERREAIARILERIINRRVLQDRIDGYTLETSVEMADIILASGFVQDEAGWRDISTAPKNHFPILTWSEQGGRCVAFLDVTWTWWPCPATEPLSNKPTHWKPLPAPPIRSARDGGSET